MECRCRRSEVADWASDVGGRGMENFRQIVLADGVVVSSESCHFDGRTAQRSRTKVAAGSLYTVLGTTDVL